MPCANAVLADSSTRHGNPRMAAPNGWCALCDDNTLTSAVGCLSPQQEPQQNRVMTLCRDVTQSFTTRSKSTSTYADLTAASSIINLFGGHVFAHRLSWQLKLMLQEANGMTILPHNTAVNVLLNSIATTYAPMAI